MNDYVAFVRLLGSIRDHLSAFRLAAPLAHVSVGSDVIDGEGVTVQLRSCGLAGVSAGLLEWAQTLTEVTATAWWPPHSAYVHLAVTGLLPDATHVHVYGGVDYSDALFGDLQPSGRHSVSLTVLRAWTGDGSAVAA